MSKKCQNCGRHVSKNYARTFGDNDNVVHHCMNCIPDEKEGATVELLRRGVTAYEDMDKARRSRRPIE